MKIKNRIHLLPENKINELYNIPNFTDQEMEIFFSLSADDHLLLTKYKTIKLKSSREPPYRDSLSHHRTSDVAYGGFAVMFTKS